MTEHDNQNNPSLLNHSIDEEYMFDIHLIEPVLISYSMQDDKLRGNIYNERYLIRPLSTLDYNRGYLELLRQLTECNHVTFEEFKERLYQMKQCCQTYYTLVIEDLDFNKQIVGTTTLVCEKKFIRQLAVRGRIEDVVVDKKYRGQRLGKLLVGLLTNVAKSICNCYKISLECKDDLIDFYRQLGYNHEDKQNYLCQRFQK